MGIEGVGNKYEVEEIEGVDNDSLPTELKVYLLWNLPTINYNHGRANCCSMGWINPIVGSHAHQNVAKAYYCVTR